MSPHAFVSDTDLGNAYSAFHVILVSSSVLHANNFFSVAIAPKVSIEEVDFDPLTVSSLGNNAYSVEVGHGFQLSCVSTGNFSGEVTWYKIDQSGGGMCECVCASVFVLSQGTPNRYMWLVIKLTSLRCGSG